MGRGGEEGIIKKKTSFYDSCQDIVNSLEAQWLGLCTSTAGAWLRSLVGELMSCVLRPGQKKTKTKLHTAP